ncbi:hypothetical protein ACTL32_13315 [Planococcus sp. FY231025]|uniref:hypothetical protein n=1 Tax=Planococcus sp. FY231025 TaxID=3455699 RepID=UPI003F912CCF
MRKYLGFVSILILFVTFLILQSLVGKYIGQWWIFLIVAGYLSAAIASSMSSNGFWKKASTAVLILLPVAYLLYLGIFMLGLYGL